MEAPGVSLATELKQKPRRRRGLRELFDEVSDPLGPSSAVNARNHRLEVVFLLLFARDESKHVGNLVARFGNVKLHRVSQSRSHGGAEKRSTSASTTTRTLGAGVRVFGHRAWTSSFSMKYSGQTSAISPLRRCSAANHVGR